MRDASARPLRRLRVAQAIMLIFAIAAAAPSILAERAQAMSMLDSFPKVNQITNGKATSFVLRFDQPVNHRTSRLTLVTPQGERRLAIRLDTEPQALFSAVGDLPAGMYELHWEAHEMSGAVTQGIVPFEVRPQ